jgi:2-amino-4-hydroxy-6-hydroxymethyldihydropteridine diphosphokinase
VRGWIGLGSNVGDRERHLRAAIALLREAGVAVARLSSVWETEPLDGAGPALFLNMAAEVRFPGSPEALLAVLLTVESDLGRVRRAPHAPREIDLDILVVEGEVRDGPDLILPHPRMFRRAFVLHPVAEIAPGLRDPATGRTVAELAREAPGEVRRVGRLCLGKTRPYNAASFSGGPAGR